MNISRFMQRITFWKMDNMKELSARNCGKRFTQSVWQQELNSHPKIGKDRSHLLTGILKCPLCGSSMYTNKHAWTNKDGTYKEVYYYICGRNKQERGHHCDYKASLRKTDIEPLVIEAD